MKVRSTAYNCARQCEMLYFWKYRRGLVPNKKGRNDMYFGSILHDAVRAHHSDEDPMQPWKDYAVDMCSKDKNPNVGRVLTKMYIKNPLNLITTEKRFEILIGKHKWVGRFDGIAEIKNALYVVDHKTTRWGFKQLKPNNQFMSYVLGGRVYYRDIDSLIVNVFNVSDMTIKPLYVSFSTDEINNWIAETKLFLSHLVRCIHNDCYPKSNDCFPYGYECEYKKLCNSSNPKGIIDRMFHVNQEAIDLSW